jgi:hypothetical protein
LASRRLRARSSAGFRQGASGDADAAEMGGEIGDFPAQEQDFLVQRRDETGHGHSLSRCDILKDVPEHLFHANACALTVQSYGACLEGVAVRALACKKVTHVSSFDRLPPLSGCRF